MMRKKYGKCRMEVEKISPVATSPLDSCRGRGKHPLLPRMRSTRPRHSPKATTMVTEDEAPSFILLVIQEPNTKLK